MSRFNTTTKRTSKTRNLAGGEAYAENPKLEFVSILLTSFIQNQYYRSADDTMDRISELADAIKDKEFIAKAALYARTKFNMRSTSHVVAREVARVAGQKWTKKFFDKIVVRPDDMLEILAHYLNTNDGNTSLPNSLKKGFRAALGRFDEYQLAKYRKDGADVSLIDLVNLVHPKPTKKNGAALKKLVDGILKNSQTWEAQLSEAGQDAETKEDTALAKNEAWKDLVLEGKLGYMALLRNLRNILKDAPEVVDELVSQLTDAKAVKNSKQLPFRFLSAIDEIGKLSGKESREVIVALNKALDLATANVPKFDGETLVALDISGSMSGKPMEIGGLFAAILAKSNNADVIRFDSTGEYFNYNPADSTLTIAQNVRDSRGGTNFHAIFETANKKYDRIVILSDMQAWVENDWGSSNPRSSLDAYKARTGANPVIYSFDLQGYGSLQFPEHQVYALAGFSEKVFDLMKLLEQDRNALVEEIEKMEI